MLFQQKSLRHSLKNLNENYIFDIGLKNSKEKLEWNIFLEHLFKQNRRVAN